MTRSAVLVALACAALCVPAFGQTETVVYDPAEFGWDFDFQGSPLPMAAVTAAGPLGPGVLAGQGGVSFSFGPGSAQAETTASITRTKLVGAGASGFLGSLLGGVNLTVHAAAGLGITYSKSFTIFGFGGGAGSAQATMESTFFLKKGNTIIVDYSKTDSALSTDGLQTKLHLNANINIDNSPGVVVEATTTVTSSINLTAAGPLNINVALAPTYGLNYIVTMDSLGSLFGN